jgi:hypothetical protein
MSRVSSLTQPASPSGYVAYYYPDSTSWTGIGPNYGAAMLMARYAGNNLQVEDGYWYYQEISLRMTFKAADGTQYDFLSQFIR